MTMERDKLVERCIEICREVEAEFLDAEYAVGQPVLSFNEWFVCRQVAKAIELEFAALKQDNPMEDGTDGAAALERLDVACCHVERDHLAPPDALVGVRLADLRILLDSVGVIKRT